jgi:hypothetical protein
MPEVSLRHHGARREGQQLAFACGNRRTGQSDDEREMRGEGRCTRHAGVEEAPKYYLGEGQHDDAERGERSNEVFRLGGE